MAGKSTTSRMVARPVKSMTADVEWGLRFDQERMAGKSTTSRMVKRPVKSMTADVEWGLRR